MLYDLIQSNLDYIHFSYGVVLFLLGTVAAVISTYEKKRGWTHLALFGFLIGLNSWMVALIPSMGDQLTMNTVRVALLAVGFIMLLEFGLRHNQTAGRPNRGPWLVFILIILAASGALTNSLDGLHATCRYFLVFPAGLLAGWAFWNSAQGVTLKSRFGARLAGFFFMAYGLTTGLIPPNAPFFPATWLNADLFAATFGIPVRSLNAMLMIGRLTGVWIYRLQRVPGQRQFLPAIRWIYPALVVFFLTLGWFAAEWSGRKCDDDMRRRLRERTSQLAETINPQRVKTLAFTADDKTNPVFERLCRQMTAYGKTINHRSIYTMSARGNAIIFGPENLAPNDPLASPPGTVYRNPPAQLWELFNGRPAIVIGPFTDEYGTFVSAFERVPNPTTGKTLIVVGMDTPANEWNKAIAKARLPAIAATLILLLILLGGLSALQLRAQRSPQQQARFRHIETFMVASLGLVATVFLTLLVLQAQKDERESLFIRRTAGYAEKVRNIFLSLRAEMDSIARFCAESRHLSRENFIEFITPAARISAVQKYGWIPVVHSETKTELEARARREIRTDFKIWEKDDRREKKAVAGRNEYYPLYYELTAEPDASLLGFDFGSDPECRAALETAARSGMVSASAPLVDFAASGRPQTSICIFQPVFAGDGDDDAAPREPAGFVFCMVAPQIFVEHASPSELVIFRVNPDGFRPNFAWLS